MNIDHVAIEVGDFDERLRFLTGDLGLGQIRLGRLAADPTRRVAMITDARGVKIELVEGDASADDRLLHLAFDVETADVVDDVFDRLVGAGCDPVTEPRRFDPARSRTATVAHPTSARYQLVAYDLDSPDRGAPRNADE